jgi:hypothetical protein
MNEDNHKSVLTYMSLHFIPQNIRGLKYLLYSYFKTVCLFVMNCIEWVQTIVQMVNTALTVTGYFANLIIFQFPPILFL